jgi:hypothetical protein
MRYVTEFKVKRNRIKRHWHELRVDPTELSEHIRGDDFKVLGGNDRPLAVVEIDNFMHVVY